jgi:hypothetical protein
LLSKYLPSGTLRVILHDVKIIANNGTAIKTRLRRAYFKLNLTTTILK